MTELCIYCKKRPINIQKWKLCASCYSKFQRRNELSTLQQYKVYHTKKANHPLKISNECITSMVNEGFTTAQIARTCNMSRQGVHLRVDDNYKTHNSYHRHYEIIFLYKIGFTIKEIEGLLKCSAGAVSNVLVHYNIKRPAITLTRVICDYYDKGKTPQEIANCLNMKTDNICGTLHKYKKYKPAYTRNKNKHSFEVNFLKRLGFTTKEIHKYTKISEVQISVLTASKFKKARNRKNNA